MSIVENTILEGRHTTNVKGAGRPNGTQNKKTYKWKVIIFDNSTKSFKEGKYTSVNHINQELNLNLNSDYVRRIMTKYRADPNMRNKENSFLARYGHIQIEKIYEPITNYQV
jgi:hypothetical protein